MRVLIVSLLLLSCKTSSEVWPDSTSLSYSNTCNNAVNKEKLSGKDVYELTESCVFNQKSHEIKIRILGETFQKVLSDGCSNNDSGYGHVLAFEIDGTRIENVGIKVRGNSSRCNPKRQFKFKFDEDEMFSVFAGKEEKKSFPDNKGRRYYGLEGISIRASANDPSMIREKIASEGFEEIAKSHPSTQRGPEVYRVAFTQFYVSFNRRGEEGAEGSFNRLFDNYYYDYKGYYSLAENLDKVFLETRYQDGAKKLTGYHLFQADKALAFMERDKYSREGWAYDFVSGAKVKEENDKKAAESVLFDLMDKLNPSTSDEELEALIDIDSVVNYTTTAFLSGHWDSLLTNANNDSLFFDGKKWHVITWDLDNSLGANHDLFRKLMSNDPYKPSKNSQNRLITTLFSPERKSFRAKLQKRYREATDGYFAAENLRAKVEAAANLVKLKAESWEQPKAQHYEDLIQFIERRLQETKVSAD